jgi:hypothetical protein
MTGASSGWDKLDLALWLTGPYSRAVRHASRRDGGALLACETALVDAEIAALVAGVREQVLAELESAVLEDGELGFVETVVGQGLVQRGLDTKGRDVWVPVDTPRAKLRDRVRSLFAADFLNAPDEYVQLYVCHYCESVVLDVDAKRRSMCRRHRKVSVSGFVPGPNHPAFAESSYASYGGEAPVETGETAEPAQRPGSSRPGLRRSTRPGRSDVR